MSSESTAEPKKSSLDNLSRDDLLQKCKSLLSIAQRAKAAKDGAAEEINALKREIEELKRQNWQEAEARAELIETLTTQKLNLTTELEEVKRSLSLVTVERSELLVQKSDLDLQLESLKRQLSRSETDCGALELRLDRLDAENRRLTAIANDAEAQLRRGAVERQDALEDLGDELVNIKNAAAEAVAERDRLRAQLQQRAPTGNCQTLRSCQQLVADLQNSQSLLKSDVAALQNAAQAMAADLGEALSEAQAATELDARRRSKDLLAEMNEAMKVRGEVAAQLAHKLALVENERDKLFELRQDDAERIKYLEKGCTQCDLFQSQVKERDEKLESLLSVEKQQAEELGALRFASTESNLTLVTLQTELGKCEAEIARLHTESQAACALQQGYLTNQEAQTAELTRHKNYVKKLEGDLTDKIATNSELSEKIVELQSTLQEFETKHYSPEKQLSEIRDTKQSKDAFTQQSGTPGGEDDSVFQVQNENKQLSKSLGELETEKLQLVTSNEELNKNILILNQKNEHLQFQLQAFKDEAVSFKEKYESAHLDLQNLKFVSENSNLELLKLKSEHETLLNARTVIQETWSQTDEFNSHIELSNKNKELTESVAQLREKLAEYEREREECDGASVSTVSRSDDTARLRDVEESFEDRYTKLRAVAVKLKQKCQDQAGVLKKVLSERTEIQGKLSNVIRDRDTLAKNLQSMQAACDAATDEAEAARENLNQRTKELKRAGEELAAVRSQQAETLERLDISEAKLQQARADFETAKQESKKNSMLNLEVAAYEKSATELEKRLSTLKDENEILKSQFEREKNTANENLQTAEKWESEYRSLSVRKTQTDELVTQLKSQLSASHEQLASESQKYAESLSKFELKRSELERLELQLAVVTAEKLQSNGDATIFKEQASRKIRSLEEEVNSTLATVQARDDELKSIQAEFEGYKARAQAVLLRQQQNKPPPVDEGTSDEIESELALLKATIERLETALNEAGSRERGLQSEMSVLAGQNSALQISARNLTLQIAELGLKCEELTKALHKSESDLKDSLRQHRLALDTLSSSYKEQLNEAEQRHKSQLARLQAPKEEISQSQFSYMEQEVQPALSQREEGEGSENVDSPKPGGGADRREPMSLDRLLSSSSDHPDDAKSEISMDAVSLSSVVASEKRAKHLAALLGEAESDLARLTQQNSVLKEEIRRQQRCMERTQHTLSNGEYLKNVILKFVTLQGGDEKSRLVPVLNTILKLSPEETQQLQTVALGAPVSPAAAAGSASWGSYLHLWSGTH